MSCRPLDVESFRNRARLPKGITRRKRAGYDESKKVSRTLLYENIELDTGVHGEGMMCSMASFKEHCAFGFWKGSLIVEKGGGEVEKAMGQFGRISKLSDLPSKKVLSGYIKQAMKLNEDGVKSPTRSKPKEETPKELVIPDDLASALRANSAASATFEKFSPSNRREYVDWLNEAKTQATRTRRLEQAVQWLAEGKPRNWKCMNCQAFQLRLLDQKTRECDVELGLKKS